MEIRLLKTFVTVARLKNFSAAARELHTVQPAISRQVADLEDELGVSLFWRSTREVKVTAAGEMLLREATEILAHEARARELVQRAARGQIGRLRIGYMVSACLNFIPELVRAYSKAYPEVQISLQEMTAQQQIVAFNAGLLDVGFSRPLPETERSGLATEDIYLDTLIVALPDTHALANAATIRLRDLQAEPFILFKRSEAVGLFDQIIGACQLQEFAPMIRAEPENMQMVLTGVAAGLGVTVVPGCVRSLYTKGCVFVPIEKQEPSIPTQLHYQSDPLQPAVAAFVEQTMKARQEIQRLMLIAHQWKQ